MNGAGNVVHANRPIHRKRVKLRLTWLSNAPFTPTGYGQQTALLTTKLVELGHAVGVISNYGHQGSVMNWKGVQIYGNSYHPYALDVMKGHSQNFAADALVTLMDLQVFDPSMLLGTKWIAWTPVDHHTLPPIILHNARQANHVLSMSRHGSDLLSNAGVENDFIPCGYDGEVFKPLDDTREDLHMPKDKFIVGMVAMNKGAPSRKAFHANIAAFAALQKKHGDCVMYIHTADGTRGGEVENLPEYCKALGLSYGYAFSGDEDGKDVIFANQYGLALGYEPEMMAKIYSAMDVLTSVTRGEGFGIPILEAQACGTPVIVGDWSAMSELCFSGWKVLKEEAEPLFTPMMAWQFAPYPAAIAEKMEQAYQMRGNNDYKKRAIKGAKPYEGNRLIQEKWLPMLKRVEAKLKEKPVNSNLELLR